MDTQISAEARFAVWRMKREGHSHAEISQVLGVKVPIINAIVKAVLKELAAETTGDAESYRQLELQRLEYLVTKLTPAIESGDPRAITAAVAISKARRELLGLDAPKKTEISGSLSVESLGTSLKEAYERRTKQASLN
jgi:hypothetical protein